MPGFSGELLSTVHDRKLVGAMELRAIRQAHTYTSANSMRTFVNVKEMANTMPSSMPANANLVYEGKNATSLLPEV